jgi:hypothetical protein
MGFREALERAAGQRAGDKDMAHRGDSAGWARGSAERMETRDPGPDEEDFGESSLGDAKPDDDLLLDDPELEEEDDEDEHE